MWRNSGASARAARRGVRRRNERIGPVIDVEKSSLGAFEQDFLFALQGAMKVDHRVRHKWPQLPARLQITVIHFAIIDRLRAERLEDAIVLPDLGLQFFRKQR